MGSGSVHDDPGATGTGDWIAVVLVDYQGAVLHLSAVGGDRGVRPVGREDPHCCLGIGDDDGLYLEAGHA